MSAGGSSGGGAPATPGLGSASGAAVNQGGFGNRRRCDADDTPETSVESTDVSTDEDPQDVPPPEIFQDPEPDVDDGAPLASIYQTTTPTNEIRLSVEKFKDRAADLASYSYTVHHDLTQVAIADLLKLSTSAPKYRSPYLMEQFIDASVNIETRAVNCCVNVCLAFTFKRAQQTASDACGAPRLKSDEKPARQVTYWSLASWLAHLLGDPVIGKSMLEDMEKARLAADEDVGGVHDYYHSEKFRFLRDRGLLGGTFVPVNLGSDGLQFWRQNGFEDWPIVATPLGLSPKQRSDNKYQLLLAVTLGPKQPVDLESFLHPIFEELNQLARGIPGLKVPNLPTTQVLRAGVLNFTTDQPGGDKLTRFRGVNSLVYNRLREFEGVYMAASNHVYYPPHDPTPGRANKQLFSVYTLATPRRTAASIAANASAAENARSEGKSVAVQSRLQQKTGVKGYSLLFAPSPAMRTAYPHLKHLWDMGPTAALYDFMHLILLNVVPHMSKLFAGSKRVEKDKDEAYIVPKSTVALMGKELRSTRRTVPRAQASSLRNIDVHHKTFKAVDWMHFILC